MSELVGGAGGAGRRGGGAGGVTGRTAVLELLAVIRAGRGGGRRGRDAVVLPGGGAGRRGRRRRAGLARDLLLLAVHHAGDHRLLGDLADLVPGRSGEGRGLEVLRGQAGELGLGEGVPDLGGPVAAEAATGQRQQALRGGGALLLGEHADDQRVLGNGTDEEAGLEAARRTGLGDDRA